MNDTPKTPDTCPHGHSRGWCGNPVCIPFNAGLDTAEMLALRYPTLQPHWRPYRYAIDTKAPEEEKERARKYAWEVESTLVKVEEPCFGNDSKTT